MKAAAARFGCVATMNMLPRRAQGPNVFELCGASLEQR
jgi:hypothetical protein